MVSEVVRISRNKEKPYSDRTHNNNNNDRSDTLSWCQTSGKIQGGILQ